MSKILIIGGSLGGLLAANVLHREGHDVCVLEKVRGSMDGRGAGIVTHDALFAGLQRAGLNGTEALGVQVQQRVALDVDGQELTKLEMPQVLTSWSRLYEALHQLLPSERYVHGVVVQKVDNGAAGAVVHGLTADGAKTWSADLVVASDGIRSVVRQQLAPQVQPQYAGYVAWRGVCHESVLSARTLTSVFEKFGFGLPAGEQLIGYPVAGQGNDTRPGHRGYNFVWYRPANETALAALLTDADGAHYQGGIPPNKVDWRQIADMRQAARTLLAPQFAEMIEKTAQPFLQPIYDIRSEQVAFGRIGLMGDASFVARPHIGMGVTKAAQDAVALADAIRDHGATPKALLAYEQNRLPEGQAAVARARWLGAYMQAQTNGFSAQQASRNAHDVVSETAIDLGRYGHLSSFPGVAAYRPDFAAVTTTIF
jgi:2-polyprenyl-6-methoxyphenol hydroxylase-like FAD-dependent oxidoreductase